MSALRTFGLGSSSLPWPTPKAQDGQQGGSRGANAEGGASLPEAAMWPTASAGDAENATGYARGNPSLVGAMFPTPAARDAKGPERQGGQGLESVLVEPAEARTGKPRGERLYPTPTATAYGTNAGGQNPGHARPSIERLLLEQQRSETAGEPCWPTPTGKDAHSSGAVGYNNPKAGAGTLTDATVRASPHSAALCLNPEWVEHLMGFPPGWTDLPVLPAPRAGGGRRAAGKRNTRGKRRGSSPGPPEDPTGGPG
jgi:hypothetical protein